MPHGRPVLPSILADDTRSIIFILRRRAWRGNSPESGAAARVLDPGQFLRRARLRLDHPCAGALGSGPPRRAAAHARRIVEIVVAHRDTIDARIEVVAPAYPVVQLARIDRALLRCGMGELLHCPTTPRRVAISEWVELARTARTAVVFAALVEHTYRGYYVRPEVHAAIGYTTRPPQPLGHELAPWREELLQQRPAPCAEGQVLVRSGWTIQDLPDLVDAPADHHDVLGLGDHAEVHVLARDARVGGRAQRTVDEALEVGALRGGVGACALAEAPE